jgi:gliding motility-associated-like protein
LPYSYQWSNANTSANIYNLAAGSYTVTVTDAHGCTAVSTAVVSSLPKPVASFTYNVACASTPTDFINTSTISAGTVSYTWDFGNGDSSTVESPSYTYPQPGTFLVQLSALSDQGCTDQVSQVVIVSALPDATISSNGDTSSSLCGADSLTLSVPESAASVYEWSTGETTSSILVNYTGTYSVTVTNAQGCAVSDTVSASVFNGADITITPDTTISLGYSVELNATGGTTYIWSPNDASLSDTSIANPVASPTATTTNTVIIHPAAGCTATRQVTVTVVEDFLVDAPNVFSPNGDGVHDFWVINNITTYPICKVTVYNRWGSEVFTAENYQNNWDGTKGGKALPDGTYYYIIKCSDKVYKGAVTILR